MGNQLTEAQIAAICSRAEWLSKLQLWLAPVCCEPAIDDMRHVQIHEPGDKKRKLSIPSPMEARVITALMSGENPKESAFRMGVLDSTFATHLARVMAAFGLHTRAQLHRFTMTHPEVMAGCAVSAEMHPDGCICLAPYCSAMRIGRQLAVPVGLRRF